MRKLTESDKKIRSYLVGTIFVILIIFLIGIFWLSTSSTQSVGLMLSFAAGLSMIVLPCTLPLVFIIVPLSMGKNYKKGLFMALLFSLGLIITLTLYGVAVALLGQSMGLHRVAQVMYIVAGVLAFGFGLVELKLIKFEMPSYKRMPNFIQKQPDYFKALLLGLFLGNAGIGCPNPATYVILTWIAASGNVFYGAALQFVNGIGRVLPLIALSILGILGVNATQAILKRKETINKITGWALIIFGALIIVWGFYGHFWFLNTPAHEGWNAVAGKFSGKTAEYTCCIDPPCSMCSEGKWIFAGGTCECRTHYAEYLKTNDSEHLDKVCPECLKGIEEGKGVFDIAERTQVPAISILSALIFIPIVWYFVKKKYSKNQDEEVMGEEQEKKPNKRKKRSKK